MRSSAIGHHTWSICQRVSLYMQATKEMGWYQNIKRVESKCLKHIIHARADDSVNASIFLNFLFFLLNPTKTYACFPSPLKNANRKVFPSPKRHMLGLSFLCFYNMTLLPCWCQSCRKVHLSPRAHLPCCQNVHALVPINALLAGLWGGRVAFFLRLSFPSLSL